MLTILVQIKALSKEMHVMKEKYVHANPNTKNSVASNLFFMHSFPSYISFQKFETLK